MPKFGGGVSNFVTTTSVKTALLIWSLGNRRTEVVELLMTGSGLATVADVPHQATACYCSTTLTGVGSTGAAPGVAEKMDGQGAATIGSCITTTFTTEPTQYTVSSTGTIFPVLFGFNTRGGNKFSVPQGEGLKIDSSATANRLGWRAQGQGAAAVDAEVQAWED
jgi:hypothetical protein